jgi:hypothetical protein
MTRYKAIFTPAKLQERTLAFKEYWEHLLAHNGAIQEDRQSFERKSDYYRSLQGRPVRARARFASAQTFAEITQGFTDQDLHHTDRRLLALATIYRFANHEAGGVRAAWASTPGFTECATLREKITRYHLCEEFCHLRLFAEMFKVFSLSAEWRPLPWSTRVAYAAIVRLPGWLLSPGAFCSEMMGIVFYRHIRRVLQDLFAGEPEVLDRLLELLGEIMVDELGHIGERRSYLGDTGVRLSRQILPMMIRRFFDDIPEAKVILDIDRMVQDALDFDYSGIDTAITKRAWIPAYCHA